MLYFCRIADGAELDLIVVSGLEVKLAMKIKLSNALTLSRGNTTALQDLGNPPLLAVTSGSDDYPAQRLSLQRRHPTGGSETSGSK